MISIRKLFLFIHVPRTGGNSVQNILRDHSEDRIVIAHKLQDGVERFQVKNDKYNTTKHSTLSEYKAALEPEVFEKLFKFATLRNPWDMMISYYYAPINGRKDWDRNEFIRVIDQAHPLSHYITLDPSKPQGAGATQLRARPGPTQLNADIQVLMRFQNLNEDFRKVCNRIGIPFTNLPMRNRYDRRHYSHYYDEELKAKVQAKFFEEIEFGDYEFEHA